MLKTLTAMQYLTPLREGGSLPAIVRADDGELYVIKFLGSGHGRKALIAELVAGEIGRALGLRVPDMALMELDPALGASEPDQEIQDLLRASSGINLGFRYLPQALAYSPLLQPPPDPDLASAIVWFDSYITNVDRTPKNVNILIWQHDLWLIDHGSSLYFHHTWQDYVERSRTPFSPIRDHVLLPFAGELDQAHASLRPRLNPELLATIVDAIPDPWLDDEPRFNSHADHRRAYLTYLTNRLDASSIFVQEAQHARDQRL